MNRFRLALAGGVLFLLAGLCVLGILMHRPPAALPPDPDPVGGAVWVSDVPGDPNKGRIRIVTTDDPFRGTGAVHWSSTYEVAGDPTRHAGSALVFQCEASGPGKLTAVMVSKKVEGREKITPTDQTPQTWDFQFEPDGTLVIRRPGSSHPQIRFQKEG